MSMTNGTLLRLAGVSALVAGICYVLVGALHSDNVASEATSSGWVTVHVLACATCFFGLLGMAGLYARQSKSVGWAGLVGYVLLSLWLTLIMGFSFVEAFVLPQIASTSPEFVEGWVGMLTGAASDADMGVLPTIWTLTGPIYILGGLLFGAATYRAAILPRLAGALLALGTLLAPLAALLPTESQPKIAIPVGLALAWLGYGLWAERQIPARAPSTTREPVRSL